MLMYVMMWCVLVCCMLLCCMLDLIITKQPDKITGIDIKSPLGSSDHATIYFNIITEPKTLNVKKL